MIIINAGSGSVEGATLDDALVNIKIFVKDCNLEGLKLRSDEAVEIGDGRYCFELEKADNSGWTCKVVMPGIKLELVRYLGKDGQDIWDFPRLYINGSSFVWEFALQEVKDLFRSNESYGK